MRTIGTLIIFLIAFQPVFGQEKEELPCLNKQFSIAAHIIVDSLGKSTHSLENINLNIQVLNIVFAPICVSFQICSIDTVPNYIYSSFYPDKQFDELNTLYNLNNNINVYYTNKIVHYSSSISSYTLNKGIQSMDKGSIVLTGVENAILPKGMARYFGLLKTYGELTNKTDELVDGSNCATTGDRICDTPADPFIKGKSGYIDDNCIFISEEKDANGDFYSPSVGNLMADYNECLTTISCSLTDQQYKKMAEVYLASPFMW